MHIQYLLVIEYSKKKERNKKRISSNNTRAKS